MRQVVVCDTGPLLHLSEAGAVHLLINTGDIFIPPCVVVEFESNAHGWKIPPGVRIRDLDEQARQRGIGWVRSENIDAGEAEAIGLALQLNANWLLTDDSRARQFAESLGLEVHGSIGLLLWNVAVGNIEGPAQALELLSMLEGSSLWISKRVLSAARKAIVNLFEK